MTSCKKHIYSKFDIDLSGKKADNRDNKKLGRE